MISRGFNKLLYLYETCWGSNLKEFPHYKYVIRPIYKMLGGNTNPLVSVPLTFALADMIFHQPIDCSYQYLYNNKSLEEVANLQLLRFLIFTSLSVPIAYYKYSKNRRHEDFVRKVKALQSAGTLFSISNSKNENDEDKNNERDYRIHPRRSERL